MHKKKETKSVFWYQIITKFKLSHRVIFLIYAYDM